MFRHYRIIHFIGIGGIGMSGIAEVLHNLGYEVTGSDARASETTDRLKALGIRVLTGHNKDQVKNAHVVVYSSAVSPDNPEVIAARHAGIPVIPRAEMLAELGRLKYGVLVAGAHGKTTTTSLIATILSDGGLDPTVVIGGKLKAFGSNAKLGAGNFLVAEADESDGSFLRLNPAIAVITNIDREHLDYFIDIGRIKEAFLSFANKVPFYGTSVVCIENEHLRDIIPSIERKVITYGLTSTADLYATRVERSGMKMSFDILFRGISLGRFTVPLPGIHNVLNSAGAITAALELHIPVDIIRDALASFGGIQRRFEFKGEKNGIRVYDDYGHHPAEISATLRAAADSFGQDRVRVLFQPHRYTRTRDLFDDFACCFDHVRLYLLDIYPAGEKPIEGVSSSALHEKIRERTSSRVQYFPDTEKMITTLLGDLAPGDVLLTLGAGNVYRLGEDILMRIG